MAVFPSAYKNQQATAETTEVKTDERISVQDAGRTQGPSRRDDRDRYNREDIRVTEEDRYRPTGRVRREEDVRVYEDDRRDRRNTRIEVDR